MELITQKISKVGAGAEATSPFPIKLYYLKKAISRIFT